MPTNHTVRQGDTLSKIAFAYGFYDWRAIYDHSDNTSFRELRPNPNLIYPGDVVMIPDRDETKQLALGTTQKHVVRIKAPTQRLEIAPRSASGELLEGWRYLLTVGRRTFEGTVSGPIQHTIPADAEAADLELVEGDGDGARRLRWTIRIGHLDPIDTISGLQARLNNLGFACGPVDGIVGPRTRAAIRAFQASHDLEIDGIIGSATITKLQEAYGC